MPIPTMPSRYATMVTSIAICEPVIFSPPSGNTYPHMKHALLFHKPLYTCITRINLIHYRNKYSTRQRINPVKYGNDMSAVMRRSCCAGRGKIRHGFGNCGREEAVYVRRRLPNPHSSADDRRPRKNSVRIRKLWTRRSCLRPAAPPKPPFERG